MKSISFKGKYLTKENIFLIFLIVFEFLLFKSYAMREVVSNTMPRNFDQATYIRQTYDVYDFIVKNNWRELIEYIKVVTINSGLNVANVIWLFLLGHSRFTLLCTNFFCFAALQIIGYKVFNIISNNFSYGIAFCGLIMMSTTIFTYVGDILDYRWDFPAFCMYTIWGLLVLLQLHFRDEHHYFIYSAISAGIMIFVRFYYSIYVAAFIVAYYLLEVIKKKINFKTALGKIFEYGFICVCAGGWAVLVFIRNLLNYINTAANSAMSVIWHPDMSIHEKLNFYFDNIFSMHLKKEVFLFALCCILITYIIAFWNKPLKVKKEIMNIGYLLIFFIIPSVIFLLQSAQNQSVLSLNMGIVSIISIYAIVVLLKMDQFKKYHTNKIAGCFAVVILGIGIISYVKGTTSFHEGYDKVEDGIAMRINAAIVDYMQEYGFEEANYIMDRHIDIVYADTMEIYSYETYGKKIKCNEISRTYKDGQYITWDWVTEIDAERLYAALDDSMFVIASNTEYSEPAIYPLDQSLENFREEIHEYANKYMTPIVTEKFNGGLVTVYAKNPGIIAGGYADGWMGVRNTVLYFEKTDDDQKEIIITGECENSYLQELNVAINELGQNIQVILDEENYLYMIHIDISDLSAGSYTCQLEFDNFFVPSEVNSESDDMRQLVLRMPNHIRIIN